MSIRYNPKTQPNQSSVVSKAFTNKSRRNNITPLIPWTRPADWIAMPAMTSSDEKIAILYAAFNQSNNASSSNFMSLICSTSAGTYSVDWGDGTQTTGIASGVQTNHQYNYDNLSNHSTRGYKQALIIVTPDTGHITSTTLNAKHPLTSAAGAYVPTIVEILMSLPNATSITLGSSTIISQGPFMLESCVILNATAITSFNNLFYNCAKLQNVSISSVGNNLGSMANMFNTCSMLVQAPLFNTSSVTSMNAMFQGCANLAYVPLYNTASVTDMSNMFNSCSSLVSVPFFNTANVTNMTGMFNTCQSLVNVPPFYVPKVINMISMFNTCENMVNAPLMNTTACTQMNLMFANCSKLENVPLYNTATVTLMNGMFNSCKSLITVPLFNTAAVISMGSMFTGCDSLLRVPLFNTANVTNMSSMFSGCISLQTVPLFNTAAVTTMNGMFTSCTNLIYVPIFNTAALTDMSSMFTSCNSLTAVPAFNTLKVTLMSSTFNGCSNLTTVPNLSTNAVTSMTSMFAGCTNLTYIPALSAGTVGSGGFVTMFGTPSLVKGAMLGTAFSISYAGSKLSQGELESIFLNLAPNVSGQTITISTNWGADTAVPLTGTLTAGSATITMASTTGLSAGMQVVGTGTPLSTPIAVTFQGGGTNTVTLNSHGLSNNDIITFSTIVTTTGITVFTYYYIINATTNTFQIATSVGGSALTLTNNGSGTMRYIATISSISVNVSVTLNRPATGSGSASLTFRRLQTGYATLKNWTVTG